MGYGNTHPGGQTSLAGNGHEGGGPLRNLTGTAQGVLYLGQFQVHIYPGGICRGYQEPIPPPQVLGEDSYGGTGGRVLQRTLPRVEMRDAGGPDFALHIQCGGGRSGPPLIIPGGGRGWGR